MKCRGCEDPLGSEGKNGLCLGCNEDLDRWAYERGKALEAELENIAGAEEEALRKAG